MFFPLFVDLSDKEILVVGAGKIASRRIHTLCGFSRRITVIAPEISPEILSMEDDSRLRILRRRFEMGDLDGKDMVLAATDDVSLNRKIGLRCRELGILVNVSSDQSMCDFQFPSIVQDGDVVIGLNASGKAHHLVRETRQKVERCLNIPDGEGKYDD